MFIHVSHSSYIEYVPANITPVLPISFTLLLYLYFIFTSGGQKNLQISTIIDIIRKRSESKSKMLASCFVFRYNQRVQSKRVKVSGLSNRSGNRQYIFQPVKKSVKVLRWSIRRNLLSRQMVGICYGKSINDVLGYRNYPEGCGIKAISLFHKGHGIWTGFMK